MHEGKEYVSCDFIVANNYTKSPSIFFDLMDEFSVECIKIGKSLFYERNMATVVMDVMKNKRVYLNDIIVKKLAELENK